MRRIRLTKLPTARGMNFGLFGEAAAWAGRGGAAGLEVILFDFLGRRSVKREIAAILAADVVGYSRLMAEDEEETMLSVSMLGIIGRLPRDCGKEKGIPLRYDRNLCVLSNKAQKKVFGILRKCAPA